MDYNLKILKSSIISSNQMSNVLAINWKWRLNRNWSNCKSKTIRKNVYWMWYITLKHHITVIVSWGGDILSRTAADDHFRGFICWMFSLSINWLIWLGKYHNIVKNAVTVTQSTQSDAFTVFVLSDQQPKPQNYIMQVFIFFPWQISKLLSK